MWKEHLDRLPAGHTVHRQGFDPFRPSLLCLHGSGSRSAAFGPLLEELGDQVNALALDLPGHGGTPGPSLTSIEDYAAWVADFLASGPVRPFVLGHSLGGAVAMTLALHHPELVSGLVLWGTGGRLKVMPAILEGIQKNFQQTVELITGFAYSQACPGEMKEAGLREMRQCPPEVLLGDFSACNAFDIMGRLGEIKTPTLVVTGEDDKLTPIKYGMFLTEGIRGARMSVVPGAGHMIHVENPHSGAHVILEFLNQ